MFEMRKVERRKRIVGTEEQDAIWEAIRGNAEHVIVEALAGTGKTTTNEEGLMRLVKAGGTRQSLGFCAFNKSVGDELKRRVPPGVWAGTTHGLGYQVLRENAEDGCDVDRDKAWNIITGLKERFLPGKWWKKGERPAVKQLVSLAKQIGYRPQDWVGKEDQRDKWLEDVCLRFDIVWPGKVEVLYAYTAKVLEKCMEDWSIVDFDDQIWLPYVLDGLRFKRFEVLMVDEAQDLNPVQHELTMKMGERLVVVGDSYQCQPEGTMVAVTARGQVPIESLNVGDFVATYTSKQSYCPGFKSQGRRVEAIQRRWYRGEMIVANGTATTLNHRWLVRLKSECVNRYAVYLMLCNGIPRLGTSQLMFSGGFGPGLRARQEGADVLWVLETCSDWEDARRSEWMLSLRYQISQRAIYQVQNNEWAEELEPHLDPGRVENLLKEFGRSLEFPFWERGSEQHVGRYSFMCRGSNLLEGCMEVVRATDSKKCAWESLELAREQYQGHVYSLQVQPAEGGRRLYIADEIVTGNSIYGFRGADPFSMQTYEKKLGATGRGLLKLPLTMCWRCPQEVIRVAKMLVPGIRCPDAKEEGLVEVSESYEESVEELSKGDMVLCRTNLPLVRLLYRLWRERRPAYMVGRDVAEGLLKLLDVFEDQERGDLGLLNLSRWLDEYERDEERKLEMREGTKGAVIALKDKCDCMRVMLENVPVREGLEGLRRQMELLFQRNGEPEEQVRLSSVHRAKGLESDNVFILEPQLMPHYRCTAAWELEQERNIAYVAITRAKKRLVFVGCAPPILNGEF